MREKLTEILTSNATCIELGIESCYTCPHRDIEDCYTAALVNHLIANGVVVQEWISVKDRLPEKNEFDWVLVVVELHSQYGIFHSVPIVAELRHGEWYDYNDETIEGEFEKVTHWMPLPPAPKGE